MSSGPTQLSDYAPPTRLIQSTGNLYWTSVYGIFRASKSSQPGDEEWLYRDKDAGSTGFTGLTFAKVDGEFYGYFVANYSGNGVNSSQIKRIPLGSFTPDGQATILANSPVPIGDNLVTDGSFLYWADYGVNEHGIRRMPIGGGPVTTLVAGTSVVTLSLLGKTLYYTDGSSAILSVPTGGGTPSTVVDSGLADGITALHVLAMPPRDALDKQLGTPTWPIVPLGRIMLVWGGWSGGVFGMFLDGGEITTYQEPTSATKVQSVYATDQRVLWSTETDVPVNQVRMSYGNDTVTLVSETGEQYGPYKELLADEVAAYWGDAYVEKFTF